jgi:hypothetical protein
MSSRFNYTFGLGHVPSFQTSAKPYLTSSLTVPASGSEPLEISFYAVSRFVVITNDLDSTGTPTPIRFGASANGVKGIENNNYGLLKNGQSFEAEFKLTKIYLMSDTANEASASVIAGLTGIENSHLTNNWSGSSGVG